MAFALPIKTKLMRTYSHFLESKLLVLNFGKETVSFNNELTSEHHQPAIIKSCWN